MKIGVAAALGSTIDAFLGAECADLIARGDEVVLLSGTEPKLALGRWRQLPIRRQPGVRSVASGVRAARRVLRDERFDVLQVHTPVAAAVFRIAALSRRDRRTLICYFVHGFHFQRDDWKWSQAPWWLIERLLALATDHYQVITESDAAVVSGWGRSCSSFPGVGVDPARVSFAGSRRCAENALGIESHDRRVLFLGELNSNKGATLLSRCIHAAPDLEWLVVGDGPERSRIVHHPGVAWIPHLDDVAPAFAAADALVSLSLREGVPVGVMEAGAAGLPVVATRNRGSRILHEAGVVCELVDRETTSVVDAIRRSIRTGRTPPRIYSDRTEVASSIADDLVAFHRSAKRER